MKREPSFMGILDSGAEEPKSKATRYAITGVAFVLLFTLGIWYLLRFSAEKHTVQRFMDAVIAGNTQEAYKIWHANPSFTFQDFEGFWGPKGYYSPLKSYQIESAEAPPKGGSGVVIVVEFSGVAPFPARQDAQTAQNREVRLWVERSDQSLSFPPP